MPDDPKALCLQDIQQHTLLDSLADGAYITDLNRRIVFWNRAAERITGWTREEVVGRKCKDNILVHTNKDGQPLCGRSLCPLHRAMTADISSEEPLLLYARHKAGHRVAVEASVAPIHDAGQQVIGGIETFRDLSEVMQDLGRARLIQQQSMEIPRVDDPRLSCEIHYAPVGVLGGDFFRVERIDQQHYAVLLADITGHGIASALYAVQFRAMWEDLRAYLLTPRIFMNELNQRLHLLTQKDDYFATAFFMVLNARSGEVQYVNAGHPAPLLFHPSGTCLEYDHHQPALGLMAEIRYQTQSACMECQDRLLLFTDGAFEIVNTQERELGYGGLKRLLVNQAYAAGKLDLAGIAEHLLAYSGGIRLPDDLVLIELCRTE